VFSDNKKSQHCSKNQELCVGWSLYVAPNEVRYGYGRTINIRPCVSFRSELCEICPCLHHATQRACPQRAALITSFNKLRNPIVDQSYQAGLQNPIYYALSFISPCDVNSTKNTVENKSTLKFRGHLSDGCRQYSIGVAMSNDVIIVG